MLPKPIADRRRTRGSVLDLRRSLLLRSRATNLAVLALAALAFLSLLLNLHLYFSSSSDSSSWNLPWNVLASLPDLHHEDLNHLIVVPGHAIWKGISPASRLQLEDWAFQSFQPHDTMPSRFEVFFQHISTAAELALADERSLVVFSGGQTQRESTTTEGESYLRLALIAGLFHSHSETFTRATSEGFAMDSFQNLLFSIARFHEYTGVYPEKITVVGYEMKRARFEQLHRLAIRWPRSRFTYIGIDVDGDNSEARKGEHENGYLPYLSDSYGCHGYLREKRKQRNNNRRFPPYDLSCPELRQLLQWCPAHAQQQFAGTLPWSSN